MEWRGIPGFPNYEISNEGEVRRLEHTTTYTTEAGVTRTPKFRPQAIKTRANPGFGGGVTVTLMRDGKYHNLRVSRLVLKAFVGPPPFPGAFALHRDDVKTNNYLENLRWGTVHDNREDAKRNGIFLVGLPEPTCRRGHEYTAENTYLPPNGGRQCRECQRIRDRAKYRRRKAQGTLVTG